jgi:Protein of unknown function (DUF2846)
MTTPRRLALFAAAALVAGCASVNKAPEAADASAKQFTANPAAAVVYVYRNETLGAAVPMALAVNGKQVATTAAKTFVRLELPAGTHLITSQGDKSQLSLEVQTGKVYYVWQEVKMGLVVGGSKLQLVPEDVGRKGVLECALIAPAS